MRLICTGPSEILPGHFAAAWYLVRYSWLSGSNEKCTRRSATLAHKDSESSVIYFHFSTPSSTSWMYLHHVLSKTFQKLDTSNHPRLSILSIGLNRNIPTILKTYQWRAFLELKMLLARIFKQMQPSNQTDGYNLYSKVSMNDEIKMKEPMGVSTLETIIKHSGRTLFWAGPVAESRLLLLLWHTPTLQSNELNYSWREVLEIQSSVESHTVVAFA